MWVLTEVMDEAACYAKLRDARWPDGVVHCPECGSVSISKNGHDPDHPACQRYICGACHRYFDDRTKTIFAGQQRPLAVWFVCLALLNLNVSARQIAQEVALDPEEVFGMCTRLRETVLAKQRPLTLAGVVECDEVYVTAGHNGRPDLVREAGRVGRCRQLTGSRGRGTLAKDKPPILGMVQREGDVVLVMLPNVQQRTIAPHIIAGIAYGARVYTDEYAIYARLTEWGFTHATVNHAAGIFARDADDDGINEVHVNTIEGIWSLLRSWLRLHRGISQEKLPSYLAFFQCMHNIRRRGRALLAPMLQVIVS